MKKLLITLCVVALVVPAMADVTITAEGNGADLEIYMETTTGVAVRGLAIELNVDGTLATSAVVVNEPLFNTYVDYYFSNSTMLPDMADETELPGVGAHPLAIIGDAGAATLGDASVSLSMGMLDNTGAKAGYGTEGNKVLIATITYEGEGNVCLTADALRGGIVGDDLGVVTIQAECEAVGAVEKCVNENAPFYADWVAFGEPTCWCYEKNCLGDADGLKQGNALAGYAYVSTDDLDILVSGWGVKEAPKGHGILSIPGAVCADFNREKQGNALAGYARVSTDDLDILVAAWGVKEAPKGPGIGDCAGADYNFFVAP